MQAGTNVNFVLADRGFSLSDLDMTNDVQAWRTTRALEPRPRPKTIHVSNTTRLLGWIDLFKKVKDLQKAIAILLITKT
jgi:hypothetical protein